MSTGKIPPDLINRAWEVYSDFTYRQSGCPVGKTDKLHWISGFSTALAVLTGSMDIGIPEGTPTSQVRDQLIWKELPEFKDQLDVAMALAKEQGL